MIGGWCDTGDDVEVKIMKLTNLPIQSNVSMPANCWL